MASMSALFVLLQLAAGVAALTVARQLVRADRWPESECRCEGTWVERHVDHADPAKVLPDGLREIDHAVFTSLRDEFLQRLEGISFSQLSQRVDLELDLAANDPDHPLRLLEEQGSADYGRFVQAVQMMAQAWGLRTNMLSQRGTFLSWMRVPGNMLMPCICPTGAVVTVSIRFPDEVYTNELKDRASEEHAAFVDRIHNQMSRALATSEPAIVDVHVTSLEAGSVVVNADILLATSMDATLAVSKVRTALERYMQQTDPPTVAEITVDMADTTYEAVECQADAPAAPVNGERSVPAHRTSGTKAVYTCSAGFVFSDGVSQKVELVCGHATRTWGRLELLCERPRTTTVAGTDTSSVSTTQMTTTTEEPELNYVHVVTIPCAAGLLLMFLLMIWCVRTEGPICSLLAEKKKKKTEDA